MTSALKPSSSRHTSENTELFKELSEQYAAYVHSAGAKCIPYDDPTVPLFSKAPETAQANALHFLENALSVFRDVLATGGNLRDDRTLIWRTLNRLGLVPESGIFDRMRRDDIVEIYGLPDHTHLGWNLNLFNYLSSTMEQLLCLPWWECTSRPREVIDEFTELSKGLVSNEITSTITPKSSWHVMEELNSHELLILKLKVNFVSPLRKQGKNAGFISINSAKVIGSNRK